MKVDVYHDSWGVRIGSCDASGPIRDAVARRSESVILTSFRLPDGRREMIVLGDRPLASLHGDTDHRYIRARIGFQEVRIDHLQLEAAHPDVFASLRHRHPTYMGRMVIETFEDMAMRSRVIVMATIAVEHLSEAVLLKGFEFDAGVDADVRNLIQRGRPGDSTPSIKSAPAHSTIGGVARAVILSDEEGV